MTLLKRLFGSRKDAAPQQADPVAVELKEIRLLLTEMRDLHVAYMCEEVSVSDQAGLRPTLAEALAARVQ